MKKINIDELRGRYNIIYSNGQEAGDDTEKSLKIIAEKLNELIDLVTKK